MISFDQIPTDVLVPGVYIETDASQAQTGPSLQPYKALLVGYRTAGSVVPDRTMKHIFHENDARDFWGAGSMIHNMAEAFFKNNKSTEVWAVTLNEDAAGAAAEGTITCTATDSAAGQLEIHIGGRRLSVSILKGDTGALLAAKIDAEISLNKSLPVTSSVLLGVVTLTANHKGIYGDSIDVQVNYSGGSLPSGMAVVVVAMGAATAGVGDRDLNPVFAAVGDERFNIIAIPFKGVTQLVEVEDEADRRWAPDVDSASLMVLGMDNTVTQSLAIVAPSNNGHVVAVNAYASPTPEWEYAAIVCGIMAHYYKSAPAVPLKTLRCKGALAPLPNLRHTRSERQSLLSSGVSTLEVDSGGRVSIERLVTTWTENSLGSADIAFRAPNTHVTIDMRGYQQKARLQSRFSRVSLAANPSEFQTSENVATPASIKAELVALYAEQIELGLVQGLDAYTNTLVVEINAQDPSRVDIQENPHLVGQLHVIAIKNQFLL